jgi:serine/threonine protein kinase
MSEPMELVPDLVIAERFRLRRLLGKGGMGSVWEAHHLALNIPCAVKFIEGEIANDPEARMRFEREAKAAAQLRSPHVVQIFDHGIHEGVPYIAMEILVGQDLRHRLNDIQRIDPRDLVRIVEQVCRALTKAHANGVVHRDLKPENIYLVKDDDREIAKVLDFGIAKKSDPLGLETQTGRVLGSPYYMSPEQANGAKIDSRSDLWSLAVIIYECVTGLRPFEADGLAELMVKIFAAPLPVPSKSGTVPPGFDRWWARAATRDPAGRFQTAKELGDSLALALGVTALEHAGVPLAAGALPALQPGAASPETTSAPVATSQAGSLPVASRTRSALLLGALGAVVVVVGGVGIVVATRARAHAGAATSTPSAFPATLTGAPTVAAPSTQPKPEPPPPPPPPPLAVADLASGTPSASAPPVASVPPAAPDPSLAPAASVATSPPASSTKPVTFPHPGVTVANTPPPAVVRKANAAPATSSNIAKKIGF